MHTYIVLFFLALSLIVPQMATAIPVSRIAAVVNGDMITSKELDQKCQQIFKQQKINPSKDSQKADRIKKDVLDHLIENKLILQQAAKEKINIPQQEINARFKNAAEQNKMTEEEFIKTLKKEGISESDYKENIQIQLSSQILMSKKNIGANVVISDEEVNEFYRKNSRGKPLAFHFAFIIYPPKANAKKWADDIASGKISFAEVAKKVSIGPNAQNGGDMGMMKIADMNPGLVQALSQMRKGQVSPLLPMQNGVAAQLKLIDLKETSTGVTETSVPDPETAEKIRNFLRQPRMMEQFRDYAKELREKAIIDIRI